MPSISTTAKIPAEFSALVTAGTAALDKGDVRLALDKFEAVILAFPAQPEGHNNLGALYSSLGDFVRADTCFTRVIELLPDNINVLYNRGIVRSNLENFDGAREDFKAVLSKTPHDASTLNNLGVTDFMQGNFAKATEHFARALQEEPSFENALLNQVDVACATDDIAGAILICEAFLLRHTSLAVRHKLLDLLSQNCQLALRKARDTAASILVADTGNEPVRQELGRLNQAKAVWQATA